MQMSTIVPFKVIYLLLSDLSQSRCYIHLRWSCLFRKGIGWMKVGGRDQREFSIPGILARISFIFSRSTMRFHFVILVPFSKHEILKEKISFSSRTPRFIRQKSRLVSKLEIWKEIFLISSRTTRFGETKIWISSQKIHISRCILLIII